MENNNIKIYRKNLNEASQKADFKEILTISLKILEILPNDYQALLSIAKVYITSAKEKTALKIFKRLIALYGDKDWDIMYYLARAQYQMTETMGDVEPVKKLLQIPKLTKYQKEQTYDLFKRHYILTGDTGLALKYNKRCIEYSTDIDKKHDEYTNYLFNLHYLHNIKAEHLYKEHKKFNNLFSDIPQYEHKMERTGKKKKIRIGYISPDFHKHAVVLFVYHMLNKYDEKYFEVYCYAKCDEDDISRQIKSYVDKWTNILGMSDKNTADCIYNDKIDILFDLAGHTKGNSLAVMARKPAPIQICGIGYFNTTGLKAMDYFLTDVFCDEPGKNDKYFTEQLLYMPHSHFGYTAVDMSWKPKDAACLKNNYITFGSMNFFTKVNSQVIKVWQSILDKVPKSRLLLKDRTVMTPVVLAKIKKRWQKAGLDLNRVDFEIATPDYFKSYYKIDIALDTFPYPGGATTCDALYMGVPVITLKGQRHGARFGYSLLKNIGSIDDCIAYSLEDYVNKAVRLANNYQRINYLHLTLREKMQLSPIMNGYLYMQNLEKKYIEIWEKYTGIEFKINREDKIRSAEIYRQSMQHKQEINILKQLNNDKKFYSNMAEGYTGLGDTKKAAKYYLLASNSVNDIDEKRKNYSAYLFKLLFYKNDILKIVATHKAYQQFFTDVKKMPVKKSNNDKIRIAYISSDFRQNVMFSFYQAMFNKYDKGKFEVTCYCLNKEDVFTEQIKNKVDSWKNLFKVDILRAAKIINNDNNDILFDLSSHTAKNILSILAYKPVGIQISGLGYMGPIGLDAIDYYLSDRYICPNENEKYLPEKQIKMKQSVFCYTAKPDLPESIGAPCEKNNYITFGSFNNINKITDEVLQTWNKILQAVPNSILVLKDHSFISLDTRIEFQKRLENLMIDQQRIYLECADSFYMQRYLEMDIALDTFPYNGGGTTCDALYMGVPVISLVGNNYVSRMGNSILNNLNLGELIAENITEYVQKAINLVNDVELVNLLHKNLRIIMQRSPLMNEKKYIQELEEKYIQILKSRKVEK
ncbi:hypothetical protein [Pectinatus brassicae]|uniref:Putative O-linked N-acetylglucosamine transferase (SPINDLY family) n=1 Tax=Pectinatus brassicae TaxID=862415 RepID=A0A840UIN6_9FIRM|nr:hypothetical protein [Pectinatus brassicae]MBB5336839.1 putative O-linked N-acetylglucosamine transferase (SPINDLY family) [Pectinatus brassicae]